MRSKFEEQLEQLNYELIEMGALVEQAISNAASAAIHQDRELAQKAIVQDTEVDQKEKDIENLCLKLLLRQQPVARDLRLISAALKMITDMERIGDQAADVSEIVQISDVSLLAMRMEHVEQMAQETIKMVKNSIEAFVKKDLNLAKQVIEQDDTVDRLFDSVREDLICLIQGGNAESNQIIDMLMIAKYFERIGDHATNIAGWVLFSITGEHKDA